MRLLLTCLLAALSIGSAHAQAAAQYYATTPQVIGPLGTLELLIPRGDDSGGSGLT